MAETATRLLGAYEIQNYVKFLDVDTESGYFRFTEVNSFEVEAETEDYETEYIDKKNQTKYAMGKTVSVEFETDAMLPGQLQAQLLKREDKFNVPVEYVRTSTYDPKTDAFVENTALAAKHAKGALTVKPLTAESGSPAKISGTLSISDDFDYGTFNETTNTYTPESEVTVQAASNKANSSSSTSSKD